MKPLIIMALAEESQGLLERAGHEVVYCGVGKVNAAYTAARLITQAKAKNQVIPLLLNLGTAGSLTHPHGTIVAVHRFVQRDMDATGIGFQHGETPFDNDPLVLEFPQIFPQLPHGVCGSGDSFLQGSCPIPCDVVDMEAYALAKVCYREYMPFASVKYITDGADGDAATDWPTNLKHAAARFAKLLSS